MKHERFLAIAALLLMGSRPADALGQAAGQAPIATSSAARLEVTSTSAEAKAEFRSAIYQWFNASAPKAVAHLERALALDPQLGLAQVLHGQLKAGLSDAQRQDEFTKGLIALAKASANEALVGLALREQFSSRQPVALSIMTAVHELLPGDPDIGSLYFGLRNFRHTRSEIITYTREGIEKHPDAPVLRRTLGYQLFADGDHAGGIAAMREYVRLAPNHPNTHQSLAELLARDGRNDEAVAEDQRAIALDSSFTGAWAHLADIKFVSGDIKEARAFWMEAGTQAMTVAESVNFAHSVAVSYLAAGDAKTATAQLADVARRAEASRGVIVGVALAPLVHQELAVLDALYGDGRSVGAHLAKAAELSTASAPSLHAYSVIAYAGSHQLDHARASAAKFSEVSTGAIAAGRHALNGFIAWQANDLATAAVELPQADINDLFAKELLAETYGKQGRKTEAQQLRQQVQTGAAMLYGSEVIDFFAVLAKVRSKAT